MTARNTVPSPQTNPGGVARHGAAIFDDPHHDPYFAKQKYAEPTACKDCGAIFHHGHWQRGTAPADAHQALCPACHRIRDKLPAGTLTLEGAYVEHHRADLAGIVKNAEKREHGEHPLARIMAIEDAPNRMVVTTTDVHLPQRIGEALKAAHDGELDIRYAPDEYAVTVGWKRW